MRSRLQNKYLTRSKYRQYFRYINCFKIFKIHHPKITGIKKEQSFLKNIFSFSTRFIFAFFILSYFLGGISPLDILNKTIFASNSDLKTIDIYSYNSISFDINQTYWHNIGNSNNEPDLSPSSSITDFNDENSTVYYGGTQSIIHSGFDLVNKDNDVLNDSISENDFNIEEFDVVASTSDVTNTEEIFSDVLSEEELAQIEEDIINNYNSTTTDDLDLDIDEILEEIENMDFATSSIEEDVSTTTDDFATTSSEDMIEINIEEEVEVEVIDTEEVESAVEIISTEEETDENLITDIISKLNPKGFFNALIVKAQSILDEQVETLEDLGKFDSAKINFSLAISNKDVLRFVEENLESDPEEESTGVASSSIDVEDEMVATSASQEIIEVSATSTSTTTEEVSSDDSDLEIIDEDELIIIDDIEEEVEDIIVIPEDESDSNIATDTLSLLQGFEKFFDPEIANAQSDEEAKIVIWYSLGETRDSESSSTVELWQKLDSINSSNLSNYLNEGYYSLEAPFIENWEDIRNLKIKIEGVLEEDSQFVVYLDSVWVEAMYEGSLTMQEKRQKWEEALELLSNQTVFQIGESGELKFKYKKNDSDWWDEFGSVMGFDSFWKDVEISASLVDMKGQILEESLILVFGEDGEFTIDLPENSRELKPGEYKLVFNIKDESGDEIEEFTLTQSFSWGVIALNHNKAVYQENETAYLQMGIVDESGHTVCDAELMLEIEAPDGEIMSFYTETEGQPGNIMKSTECGPETVTDVPDYYTYYDLKEAGSYFVKLIATTSNGVKEINDEIIVVNKNDLEAGEKFVDIERQNATRIYPKEDYSMTIKVKTDEAYRGDIVEYLPARFKLVRQNIQITNNKLRDPFGSEYKFEVIENEIEKKLVWTDIELNAGDELEITYVYDAPDRAPDLFLLGPLSFDNYIEKRQWQIASDAVNKRAKTVRFLAGLYNGGDTVGQDSDSNLTFSTFNFQLAETGVDIKNAYILFESQIAAYSEGINTYTGYDLAFDSCVGASCSLNPFSSGVVKNDTSILVYDENESNQIRLVFDVTAETQLASYTGSGAVMNAQMGYNLKQGVVANAIANAKAILVLTYTYDADSENLTNTVSYPMDSTVAGDSGSTQAGQGSCTFGSCPAFEYKMDIPDFPGVATTSERLSEWYTFYGVDDSHNANDLDTTIQIQGESVASDIFHHEANWGGTQGNLPRHIWENVTGYAENATQTVEFMLTYNTYVIGGEITETYISSSSAPVKTRTVTFPVGVIQNGGSTVAQSGAVNVYFPENGSGTGNVKVKKAWFRIYTSNNNSANNGVTINTRVGDNATTTSSLQYVMNAGGTVIKPSYNIYHIIPSADYSELENANAVDFKQVAIEATNDQTTQGGTSAELVITYTYTDESDGYLTNVSVFAGQTDTNGNDTLETETTANSVLPESAGKTILAAGIHTSYLFSDSDGDMGTAGQVYSMDVNLAESSPSCTNAYQGSDDSMNSFIEYVKDVTSAMNTTDNQSYSACYSNDGASDANRGAKMNGILTYTYVWENTAPTSTFVSALQNKDGNGIVDLSIEVDDDDDHDVRAKIEYATGTICDFSTPGDPTIDESDVNITADWGDPNIENDNEYQIGVVDAYIRTASGSNTVNFDWNSKIDLPNADGEYCLRLTANDLFADQSVLATTTLTLDNINPTAPGALSYNAKTGTSITLNYGATTTESNFYEYIIYYKEYDGTDPDEGDSIHGSSTDINLSNILFNDEATTTISGLTAGTVYSFSIWAIDDYGNKASSSRVDIVANDLPIGNFNLESIGQKTDGSNVIDVSISVDDNNDDYCTAKLEYTSADCDFTTPLDPSLDETAGNISTDVGIVTIENDYDYQIGTGSNKIITLVGENNVNFDWLIYLDEPLADTDFCIRLTVNDGYDDQLVSTTTIVTVDNFAPTAPGDLSIGSITTSSVQLIFDTDTFATDTNEPTVNAYKIFYKEGTSGVSESDSEFDISALDSYDYSGATSTIVTDLSLNTYYVFNIWAYDQFGNKISATEVSAKTDATIYNQSLSIANATSSGSVDSIVVADGKTPFIFRAVVSELNGWQTIASTTLRLEDNADGTVPYQDVEFYWDQTTNTFNEIGSDIENAVSLDLASSSATCAGNSCTLDFALIFNYHFDNTDTYYNAELFSLNDSGIYDRDFYTDDFYQVRKIQIEQIHYRWRNDDGDE